MTRRVKVDGFIEFVSGFSLIDAKSPVIRDVHQGQNLSDVLDQKTYHVDENALCLLPTSQ